jgi:ABC-type transporter MlaC component
MRSVVRLVVTLLVVALPAAAAAEDRGTAFRTVIEAQLEAFQRDDGNAAFAHASPMIKDMFRTPDTFMAMVVRGYPQVYRPRSVDFGATTVYRGQPAQIVYLVGPDGEPVIAYYQMQQQPDGTWKINGVYLEQPTNV